tara:strand:+ start:210 stop:980 length:771 start_codon:yes stop_codon:yes gene_type:complete
MKKTLTILAIIFILGCGKSEEPIIIPETVKIIETVTIEVTKVVEKEKIIYLDPTYNPDPTWTPTPFPIALPTWTPTPVPLALPTWTPTPVPLALPTWTPTPTPQPAATWTPTPTPTATPVLWEFYLDGILVTPTPRPAATWTPTPTPRPAATWTPTPTPTPLPPGDLGFVKTSIVTNYNFTSFGEQVTVGIPMDKSPIVDHNQNGDLTDEITTNDDSNYKILSVKQNKNSNSEIVILCLTPINTPVTITFWTTRKE